MGCVDELELIKIVPRHPAERRVEVGLAWSFDELINDFPPSAESFRVGE